MMRRWAPWILLTVMLGFVSACGKEEPMQGDVPSESLDYGAVWHVVVFRFKNDPATLAAVRDGRTVDGKPAPSVIDAFRDLQSTVVDPKDPSRKLIRSFDYGVNNSTEQLTFGVKGEAQPRDTEYVFIATFDSVEDRDYYVDTAPTHQAFKKLVGDYLEVPPGGSAADSVFVIDFKAGQRLLSDR